MAFREVLSQGSGSFGNAISGVTIESGITVAGGLVLYGGVSIGGQGVNSNFLIGNGVSVGIGVPLTSGEPSEALQIHGSLLVGDVTACGGTSVIVIGSGTTPTTNPAHGSAGGAGGVTAGILWVTESGTLMYRSPLGTDTVLGPA